MYNGKVKFFNQKSRFGFITEEVTGTDYYFHIKDVSANYLANENVKFELKDSKRGKEAINIVRVLL